jgi:2-polyprenyl-6-methoxyphenol hydroxylase-like FAD-dependent oxidoreductase
VSSFFSAPHLDHFYAPSHRVLLIGDSAHAIPPTGGQGAAMALEDAETLAYALAEIHGPDRKARTATEQDEKLAKCIMGWDKHRHERISKVLDFTTKNGNMRKSSNHFYEQAAKEWLLWAVFKWMGPEGGARWLYTYAAENVRAAFA